jgi:hypothetical protein
MIPRRARGGPLDRLAALQQNGSASETSGRFGIGELEAAIEGALAARCGVPARGNPFRGEEVAPLARAWAHGWRRARELDGLCERQHEFWGRAA